MSILGRDIPSQRKNRTLLKRTVQMVMLSFWLPNYMEYTCKAWFYREKKQTTIFLGTYLEQDIPLEFRYMLVHSKKIFPTQTQNPEGIFHPKMPLKQNLENLTTQEQYKTIKSIKKSPRGFPGARIQNQFQWNIASSTAPQIFVTYF